MAKRAGALFIISLALSAFVFAQDSVIQGVVVDESNAVVPGADVTVTNLRTGIPQKVATNDVGFYSVPLLKEGKYLVRVTLPGFTTQEATIQLAVGQVSRLDFELKVGEVSQVVEVSAAGEQIQAKATDVGQVIDERRIENLPLNGRNYLELGQLSVGTVRSVQGGRGDLAGEEAGFKTIGLSVAQNTVMLDGADNSSRLQNSGGALPSSAQTQAVKPPIEAISEFKVITNNTSAEFGYRVGAKILVSTRSGTNEFHGSLYEFHRNDALSANNFFFNKYQNPGETGVASPKFIRNQFGASIGGPIIRERTFFFFSYQGTRLRRGLADAIRTVPSPSLRQGDFSNEPGGSFRNSAIYDPLTLSGEGSEAVRQPFTNNVIPQERWDPISAQVMSFYPLPNCLSPGCENLPNNYFASPTEADDADQYDARIDHNFNDLHRIFGRISFRDQLQMTPGAFPIPGESGGTQVLDAQNLALNYSATFGPTMNNEFRFAWTHFPTEQGTLYTENLNQQLGIKGTPNEQTEQGSQDGVAGFLLRGFSTVGGGGGLKNTQETYQVADNFLWELGRHSLKFGGEYRRLNLDRIADGFRRGLFIFTGPYTAQYPNVGSSLGQTGNSYADFLLGWVKNGVLSTVNGENILVPYYGFYVQDDWRVSRNLTLNLGLRWELFDGPYYPNPDTQNISRFTFTGDLDNETLDVLDVEFTGWELPTSGSDCACERDLKNFGPRIGLAYRVGAKTVIRAGGGLYYGENDFNAYEAGRFKVGPPKAIQESNDIQPNTTTTIIVSDGFNPIPEPPPADVLAPPGFETGGNFTPSFLPTLSSGQWFLDVQHEFPWDLLVTLGYNGMAASHLSWWRLPTAPLDPHPFLSWSDPSRRRWPQPADPSTEGSVRGINEISNVLNANYNAFTLKGEKRFSGGLTFLSSFTWSKNIDYSRGSINERTEGSTTNAVVSQHIKDLPKNRGLSFLNRAVTYNLSFLYEIPLGRGHTYLNQGPAEWVLGGWQLGGILAMSSGPPLTHNMTPDTQNTLGAYRGDLVGDPNLPESQRTVEHWFNTDFAVPGEPGTFGNAGRSLIDGPGWKSFDLMMSKDFSMPWEGQRLQFRFESFNLTNTPHFGAPGLALGTANAGQITSADEPRLLQFALKYIF